MTRLGTSVVDCGGAGQSAETPIAASEMAEIRADGRFIGSSIVREKSPSGRGRRSAQRRAYETTGARQWEQQPPREETRSRRSTARLASSPADRNRQLGGDTAADLGDRRSTLRDRSLRSLN